MEPQRFPPRAPRKGIEMYPVLITILIGIYGYHVNAFIIALHDIVLHESFCE